MHEIEHPAVKAWHHLQPQRIAPQQIETLEKGKKTAVYRLEGLGPHGSAVIAKRCRKKTALIERTIYEEILPRFPDPTLRYYGCVVEGEDDFCWLFLEDAGGEPYSSRIKEHRVLAAHWLGLLHLTAAHLPVQACLPERGPGYFLEELRATRDIILQNLASPALQADDVVVLKAIVSQYDVLESRWRQVEALCNRMPQTLVHGDFAEKNMRFRRIEQDAVLLAFDWEMAGWGTPAVDFAQFMIYSVSPHISTYLSVVRPYWPHLDVQDLKQLASIGTIFRVINSITWEQYGLVYDRWVRCGLAYECAQWTMHELRAYLPWLDDAIRAVHWGDENQ